MASLNEIRQDLGPTLKLLRSKKSHDPTKCIKLSPTQSTNPLIFVILLQAHCPWIQLPDGYTLNILEYITERGEVFIISVIEGFGITKYLGSISTAIDFLYLIFNNSYEKYLEVSSLSYEEVLKRGYHRILTHLTMYGASEDRTYDEACILYWAFCENPHCLYSPVTSPSGEDPIPLDVVRLKFFNGILNQSSPYGRLEGRKRDPLAGSKPKEGWVPHPIERYIICYQRVSSKQRNDLLKELETYLPSVLTLVVLEYLWGETLENRAQELGMVFPPHLTMEAEHFRYYFDNVGWYRGIFGDFGYSATITLEDLPLQKKCFYKTDHELLALKPLSTTWNNRMELMQLIQDTL